LKKYIIRNCKLGRRCVNYSSEISFAFKLVITYDWIPFDNYGIRGTPTEKAVGDWIAQNAK